MTVMQGDEIAVIHGMHGATVRVSRPVKPGDGVLEIRCPCFGAGMSRAQLIELVAAIQPFIE